MAVLNDVLQEKIYIRNKYLVDIRKFYYTDEIKIITGLRRCGKSNIMKSIIQEMKNENKLDHIIYIPLDNKAFNWIDTPKKLEEEIESHIKDKNQYIILIDEIQNIKGFEKIILQYHEENYSIFLTGSNSYLLSDEISTKLTGRYLNFEIFPLDFNEYIEFKKYFNLPINENIYDEFNQYIVYGGLPKAAKYPDINQKVTYIKNVIREIFNRDVYQRTRINNKALFERIEDFFINNYANTMSLIGFHQSLLNNGIKCKYETVRNYIEIIKKAKIIYECNRFDLKSKKSLAREQKYYLSDLSFYFIRNVNNQYNYGHSLENIVYIYLRSLGYEVSIGKISKYECDFIARKQDRSIIYIQVALSLQYKSTENREYRTFSLIKDNYPKYIISLDQFREQINGIKHINAIDLFLKKEKI